MRHQSLFGARAVTAGALGMLALGGPGWLESGCIVGSHCFVLETQQSVTGDTLYGLLRLKL
jgi:hypothetical protein